MFVQIFTTQPLASIGALAEGALWSAVFGGLAALVFAVVSNLIGMWRR
jgi:hypothetical protein